MQDMQDTVEFMKSLNRLTLRVIFYVGRRTIGTTRINIR